MIAPSIGNFQFFPWAFLVIFFFKLQPKQRPRLGVDFVFPLSQEEQEQEEEQPHQNLSLPGILGGGDLVC